MKNCFLVISLMATLCGAVVGAQTSGISRCPGPNYTLSCQPNTTFGFFANSNLSSFSPTLATQLNQLPLATAITGQGATLAVGGTKLRDSVDSLGSIYTERGDTVGKYNAYVSVSYQRFHFNTLGGADLKGFDSVSIATLGSGSTQVEATRARFDITDDQLTVLGVVGVRSWLDVAVIVPFSKVTLKTQTIEGIPTNAYSYTFSPMDSQNKNLLTSTLGGVYFPGSAVGLGDLQFNVKARLIGAGEARNKLAAGFGLRLPTGNEYNYLGTGAYGFKPYLVYSRTGKWVPHVNLGYQFNTASAINRAPVPSGTTPGTLGVPQRLPGSLEYSTGFDYVVKKRQFGFTVVADLIGQHIFSATVITPGKVYISPDGTATGTPPPGTPKPDFCDSSYRCNSLVAKTGQSYTEDNLSLGIKFKPWGGGLIVSANALIKLDNAGLRSNVVPLIGLAYRF